MTPDGSIWGSVTSDSDGKFRIAGLAPGPHLLRLTCCGDQDFEVPTGFTAYAGATDVVVHCVPNADPR